MKPLTVYITEKLIINKNYKNGYKYHPTTKKELIKMIQDHYNNKQYDLNNIDVSEITDFSELFKNDQNTGNPKFNVSQWDVSSGKNFSCMFDGCEKFNSDLSQWDVGNGEFFSGMFYDCENFNSDLSEWNVSWGKNFCSMFFNCKNFNCDLSEWDVGSGGDFDEMFSGCEKFNQNLSQWNLNNAVFTNDVFYRCPIKQKYKPKPFKY